MSRLLPAAVAVTLSVAATLLVAPGATADEGHDHGRADAPAAAPALPSLRFSAAQVAAEVRAGEVAAIGRRHAEEHARQRLVARAMAGYSQLVRSESLAQHAETQDEANARFNPEEYGEFAEYFQSPDFGDHVALLPTGKVLLFSFERIETDPTEEPAPTETLGRANAGRAYLWDPAAGTGADAFKKVTPPVVAMPDGQGEPRPAPFFCAGHAFLPNGMLGVFGGNLGGKGGSGAKLSLVFDPWTETWSLNREMSVGRWYPSVVQTHEGRLLIMAGQSEEGWGHATPVVERFPAKHLPVPTDRRDVPRDVPVDRFGVDAPFAATSDYPHLFSLRDGMVYGLGREPGDQWRFDPDRETRTNLPSRPDGVHRGYGSAVPLPAGFRGPDSILVLGGDRDDPNTYRLADGKWTTEKARAFGRTQDDTVILPDGTLLTLNGAYDIRDYGNGPYNPQSHLKYRQLEKRDDQGDWKLGPVQRLPRGYHSNAVVLPDGRIMITGDELQQLANDPDINDENNGSIEIYEPAYLHQGSRPTLTSAPSRPLGYGKEFTVRTSTPDTVERAVLLAPTTATHAVNFSQRHLDLRIHSNEGGRLRLETPPSAKDAPPGYYMLFLLDDKGVPSVARFVSLQSGR